MMRFARYVRIGLTALLVASLPRAATAQTSGAVVEDFRGETIGAEPTSFSPQAGFWSVAVEENRPVLLEDGNRWQGSDLATGLAARARALYGDRWNEFIDDLAEAAYFPLAAFNKVDNFTGGTLSVRFKVLGGTFDQDCGLAFNVQDNGDFLALKSDTIENNLVLYQSVQGRVVSLQRVLNVQTSPDDWHEQKLIVNGSHLTGLVDGQVRLDAELDGPPSGRVGVFAKRDTVVVFAYLTVDPTLTVVPTQTGQPIPTPVAIPVTNLGEAVDWARQGDLTRAHGELQDFLDDWDSVQDSVRQRSPDAAGVIAAAVAEARRVLLDPNSAAPDQATYVMVLERLQRTVSEQQRLLD